MPKSTGKLKKFSGGSYLLDKRKTVLLLSSRISAFQYRLLFAALEHKAIEALCFEGIASTQQAHVTMINILQPKTPQDGKGYKNKKINWNKANRLMPKIWPIAESLSKRGFSFIDVPRIFMRMAATGYLSSAEIAVFLCYCLKRIILKRSLNNCRLVANQPYARLKYSEIRGYTGLCKRSISKALNSLNNMGLLNKVKTPQRNVNKYGLTLEDGSAIAAQWVILAKTSTCTKTQ